MVFTTDQLVAKYIELRDYKDQLKAEYEAKLAPVDQAMEAIHNEMLQRMNEAGETSKKTAAGTAFIKESTFVGAADWESVLDFIRRGGHWGFLTRSLNKTAVLEYLNEHNEPPPGVNITTKREVQFRKPSKV